MIVIKELSKFEEISELPRIERETWGTNDTVPTHIFIAGKFIGGLLLGAYYNDKLVGYVFGFPGIYEGRICHYSHQLAVIPKYRNLGIGATLKMEQKRRCLERGIDLIVWTFDPLQALNAYFNLRKLSVISSKYLINHYGTMKDQLNRGLPTDRLVAEWWINSKWVDNRLRGLGPYYEKPENIVLEVEFDKHPIPKKGHLYNSDCLSIPIPVNINEIKKEGLDLAIKWREATRDLFLKYIDRGYYIIDFIKDGNLGYYILVKKKFIMEKILG